MLFEEFSLKSLTLKNRIVMPPMCMYSAEADGKANDWHFIHYTSRAVGQVGLIIVEATGIEPGGRISANDLGLWEDAQIDPLRRIVAAVHERGSKIAIQLNHAGRKSEVPGMQPVAPSPLPFNQKYEVPRELTKKEIATIVENFQAAVKRAVQVGFDAIEIHAAHGYLINQFLSPLTNCRTDEYGGSLENRTRLLQQVAEAARRVMPQDMPLFVRVSAHEYEADGNTPEVVSAMLNIAKDKGIDLVHVSSGAVTPTPPAVYPSYQIAYALTVKEKTGLPVIGGGLITEALQAEQVIKAGVDLVFLGRELLRAPYWPLQAAHSLQTESSWPQPYVRAKK